MIICLLLVPAKIHQIRGGQTVLEGGNLQLTCEASGKPEANITWAKEKTGNHVNSVLQVGKVLSITKISRNDSGTFNCTAYNGFGEAHFSLMTYHLVHICVDTFFFNMIFIF